MKPARILIVEDEFIVASDIEARLLDLGYVVSGKAASGPEALELAGSQEPDLVLMDIRLRGPMDGITAALEIRQRFDLPSVFLTAYAEDSTLQRAKAAEPFGYILKPFEDRELRTSIEIGLFKHKAEREIRRLNRLYATSSRVNQAIVRIHSPQEFLREVCDITAEYTGFKVVWIGWHDRDTPQIKPVARAGEAAGYLDKIKVYVDDRAEGRGPVGTCIRENKPCIIHDFLNDPRTAPWHEAALAHGLRAAAAFPIQLHGEVWGAFTVYADAPGVFQEKEVALLAEAALDVSFGLDHLDQDARRQKAEEQIRDQARLLDLAHDAIMVRDIEDRLQFWNRGAERLYGWTAAEVCGVNAVKLLYQDALAFGAAKEAVLAANVCSSEFQQVTKTGQPITVHSRWTLVRDTLGQPQSVLVISTDVTEQKQLRKQLERAQRLEALGTLASGVTHDLNNILTPILTVPSLLRTRNLDPEAQELLATIEECARRGAEVIKQLLTIGRSIAGEHVLVQPRYLVREVVKLVRETFPRNLVVRQEIAGDLGTVLAEATQLHRVLLNLCVNARDAMPEGGTLWVRAFNFEADATFVRLNPSTRVGPYVVLEVADTGHGIPGDVLDRIFDPFFTTKPVGEGTGLGLSTVSSIVRSHRGLVMVTSEVGKGATFRVYLPATSGDVGKARTLNQAPLPPGRGELILVVDDEATVRDTTRATLEQNGFQVVTASHGAEALARFQERPGEIKLVFTDVLMPVMDGVKLARSLKALDPGVRIVVTTGLSSEARQAELRDLGVGTFLRKPYQATSLLAAIRESLRRPL